MRLNLPHWSLLAVLLLTVASRAVAQDDAAPATSLPTKLVLLEAGNLAGLPAALPGAGGVSVRISRAALEGNQAAYLALTNWVRAGGVVFLHNDAAQIFGYTTVPARAGSNRRGGQLYGRARAALGFNANPLLADDGTAPAARQTAKDVTRLPGVNVVFYEMAAGDHLVTAHPAATPLLEVTDLASGDDGQTLYAAAIAPFGEGWAVFTPDYIDNRRADGALFLRNLLKLMPSAKGPSAWIGVSIPAIEAASANLANQQQLLPYLENRKPAAPVLPGFGTGAAPAIPAPETTAKDSPKLLLTRAEAASLAAALRAGETSQGTATLQILRARVEWQRQDGAAATTWLNSAEAARPGSAEVAFWRGVLWAGSAQDISKASPIRSEAMAQAAGNWQQAGTIRPMLTPAAGATVAPLLPATWAASAQQLAQTFAAEPPVVEVLGTGKSAITVRHFANDDTYALSIVALKAIANSTTFGWRADREEVLLFPSEEYYGAYRRASGQTIQSVPLPAGNIGDVIGSRILMVGWPAFPTFVTLPNGTRIPVQQGGGAVNVIARFHAYALMFALDEDGAAPPGWMRLGLETMLAAMVQGDKLGNMQGAMQQYAAAGGLLTANQFNVLQPGGQQAPNLAEIQATSMMLYFYKNFGAGAVAETLQRLGSRQSVDDALEATTGGDQSAFFQSWREDTFGPQTFPNRNP